MLREITIALALALLPEPTIQTLTIVGRPFMAVTSADSATALRFFAERQPRCGRDVSCGLRRVPTLECNAAACARARTRADPRRLRHSSSQTTRASRCSTRERWQRARRRTLATSTIRARRSRPSTYRATAATHSQAKNLHAVSPSSISRQANPPS